MSEEGKYVETESRLEVAQGWEWEWEMTVNRHKASYLDDRNVIKLNCGDQIT